MGEVEEGGGEGGGGGVRAWRAGLLVLLSGYLIRGRGGEVGDSNGGCCLVQSVRMFPCGSRMDGLCYGNIAGEAEGVQLRE